MDTDDQMPINDTAMVEPCVWFDGRVVPILHDLTTTAGDLAQAVKDYTHAIDRQHGNQAGW